MNVLVVESPAKAKTINKYLGSGYKVLASFGHIRDLPPKDGSVKPDEDFAMLWEVDSRAQKRIKDIVDAMKGADKLILATDPDREGEAISWHVLEVLRQKNALKGAKVERVAFNAITKNAVLDAIAHPREINVELVDAYLARRALDYLVGFTLSPVLWRKLPGAKSAGRVQSVALRLVCERETEIEAFKPQEYWTIDAAMEAKAGNFGAHLTHLDGKKLDKLSIARKKRPSARLTDQRAALHRRLGRSKAGQAAPPRPLSPLPCNRRRPANSALPPSAQCRLPNSFMKASTLAAKPSALITYMRTDGIQMAGEGIAEARDIPPSNMASVMRRPRRAVQQQGQERAGSA